MKIFRYVSLALLLPACTFQPQGDSMNAEFHPPLTYQTWQVQQNGKSCALSSGYNGLTVTLYKQTDGNIASSVMGNHNMNPGSFFTVNVNGQRYETNGDHFTAQQSAGLVDSLSQGGKAYLEWSEYRGGLGIARRHVNNIVKLDGFAAKLGECRSAISGARASHHRPR